MGSAQYVPLQKWSGPQLSGAEHGVPTMTSTHVPWHAPVSQAAWLVQGMPVVRPRQNVLHVPLAHSESASHAEPGHAPSRTQTPA